MSKQHILYEMMWYIRNKRTFTAQELANEFGVSIRSIYRYITDLADLGLYVEAHQGRNGGFEVLPNQLLPPVLFTEDEILSLYVAIHSLTAYQNFPFKLNIVAAQEKLLQVVPDALRKKLRKVNEYFRVITSKQIVSAAYLDDVFLALLEKRLMSITYQTSKHIVSQKQLVPIGIYANNGFWYLYALDYETKMKRHYRIDRIQEIIELKEKIEHSANLREIDVPYQATDPIKLHAKLTTLGAKRCLEDQYLHSGVNQNANKLYELSMVVDQSDLLYISNAFLLMGKEAVVTEPPELLQILEQRTNELGNLYAKK